MNRMARIVLDPNRTYAGTRTAVQLCGSHLQGSTNQKQNFKSQVFIFGNHPVRNGLISKNGFEKILIWSLFSSSRQGSGKETKSSTIQNLKTDIQQVVHSMQTNNHIVMQRSSQSGSRLYEAETAKEACDDDVGFFNVTTSKNRKWRRN